MNRLVPFDRQAFEAAGKNPGWNRQDDVLVFGSQAHANVMHVTVTDGEGKVLYDSIIRAEQGGGVFLPVDDRGNIYLQEVWRFQTPDQAAWAKTWPNVNVGLLGRKSWECPRGFANLGESGDKAAVREAREETGFAVAKAFLLGEVCDNTTFSPHMTAVQLGQLDLSKRSNAGTDPNEGILKKIRPFTRPQTKQLFLKGELYCGYTLAAIAAYLLSQEK